MTELVIAIAECVRHYLEKHEIYTSEGLDIYLRHNQWFKECVEELEPLLNAYIDERIKLALGEMKSE